MQANINAAWQQKEEARKSLRASPDNDLLRKAVIKAGKKMGKVRKAAVLSFFWAHVRKLGGKATRPAFMSTSRR